MLPTNFSQFKTIISHPGIRFSNDVRAEAQQKAEEMCAEFSEEQQDACKEEVLCEVKLAIAQWVVSDKSKLHRNTVTITRKDIETAVNVLSDSEYGHTDVRAELIELLDGNDLRTFLKSCITIYNAKYDKQFRVKIEACDLFNQNFNESEQNIASDLQVELSETDEELPYHSHLDACLASMLQGSVLEIDIGNMLEEELAEYCSYFGSKYAPNMLLKIKGQFNLHQKLFKAFFDCLATNPTIESITLDISGCGLGSDGIRCISKLKKIVWLDVSANNLGPKDGACFTQLVNLTELNVKDNKLQNRGVMQLMGLTNLVGLNFSNNGVDNDGTKGIHALKNLRRLNISNNNMTSLIIRNLIPLQDLSCLFASQINLGRTAVNEIKKLSALKKLDVSNNNLSRDIIDDLKSIDTLEWLAV